MRYIITGGKWITIVVLMVIFIFGFVSGNRYGESIPVLNQRLVPIYRVSTPEQKVAITLDGTWGADNTEKLLDIFSKEDITVTFFFAGYWLEKYPHLVEKIALNGHEIGNHTYTHPHCNQLSREQLIKELKDTSDLIEDLIGTRPKYFRPPFGEYNNRVIETARGQGYQVVQWSIDSLDWQEPGIDFIVNRILDNVASGEIILLHNNAPHTPEALTRVIPKLKNRGFEIVPLSKLIYKDNYIIQPHNGLQVRQK